MPNVKTRPEDSRTVPSDSEHEVDNVVRHYGVTREQARQLIKQYGSSRKELEAAAGQLRAKRMF
jgi:hypothetical protein